MLAHLQDVRIIIMCDPATQSKRKHVEGVVWSLGPALEASELANE